MSASVFWANESTHMAAIRTGCALIGMSLAFLKLFKAPIIQRLAIPFALCGMFLVCYSFYSYVYMIDYMTEVEKINKKPIRHIERKKYILGMTSFVVIFVCIYIVANHKAIMKALRK